MVKVCKANGGQKKENSTNELVVDTESVNKKSIWRPLLHSRARILTFHLPVFLSGRGCVHSVLHTDHLKQMHYIFPEFKIPYCMKYFRF